MEKGPIFSSTLLDNLTFAIDLGEIRDRNSFTFLLFLTTIARLSFYSFLKKRR